MFQPRNKIFQRFHADVGYSTIPKENIVESLLPFLFFRVVFRKRRRMKKRYPISMSDFFTSLKIEGKGEREGMEEKGISP